MKTIINIKADKEVKENAQKIAEELGLSLSAVMNAQLKQFIRNRAVYFSSLPQMSTGLERLLGPIEKDIKKKQNLSKPLTSFEDISRYLDNL